MAPLGWQLTREWGQNAVYWSDGASGRGDSNNREGSRRGRAREGGDALRGAEGRGEDGPALTRSSICDAEWGAALGDSGTQVLRPSWIWESKREAILAGA